MSASKTVYPGMQTAGNDGVQNGMPFANTPHPMTQYPGMTPNAGVNSNPGKPIMGFLFSVSKTPCGEFWPLYVGQNTIGRGNGNSVKLGESSVSENHATIVIRKMQNKGANSGVLVFIQDTASTCGTQVNGLTLGFDPQECKHGDIITVGENYELYLILIDPEALGLSTKENFQSTQPVPVVDGGWIQQPQGPINVGGPSKGTVPGTGATPFDDGRRPTIYMPNKK